MAPLIDVTNPEALLRLFAELLVEPGRINGHDLQTRVGLKYQLAGRPYVVLHEGALLHHLAEVGRLDAHSRTGDGQHRLTYLLLQVLGLAGVLYTEHAGVRYRPSQALWGVEFHDAHGRVLSQWPAALVVAVGDDLLPQLAALADAENLLSVRDSYAVGAAEAQGIFDKMGA